MSKRTPPSQGNEERDRSQTRTKADSRQVELVRPGTKEYEKAVARLLKDKLTYDEFLALVKR